ncbi:MAG: helix-hairpin-helix domain-containing protein [Thermoplasmata archaeon]
MVEEAPPEEVVPESPEGGEAPRAEDREAILRTFTTLPGIGPATAEALWEAGFTSVGKLQAATEEELTRVKGLGPASARKILARLREVTA